jgi:hypothetical protein
VSERKVTEAELGQRAKPKPAKGLPDPDWDSGDVPMTPFRRAARPSGTP